MEIDSKTAETIARELLRKIASEWQDVPNIHCAIEKGDPIFVLTLEPGEIVRYARRVERPFANSTFHFNPLAEATEIVISCASHLDEREVPYSEIREHAIRDSSESRIRQMIFSAPKIFQDAMWHARVVGETLVGLDLMRVLGRPDIARGLIKSTLAMFEDKFSERLGRIRQKQKPKISEFGIHTALRMFLADFKQTGKVPSQRRFAAALKVTPKGWRDFLLTHGLGKHEVIVKKWLDELLIADSRWQR